MQSGKAMVLDAQWLRDAFLQFEEVHRPFDLLVEDFSLWPKLRFLSFESMRDQLQDYTPRPASNPLAALKRRAKKIAALWELPLQQRKLKRLSAEMSGKAILAFTSGDRLRDRIEGSYRNYCFDFFSPPLENILSVYGTELKSELSAGYSGRFIKNALKDYYRIRATLVGQGNADDALRELYETFQEFMAAAGWPTLPRGLYQTWQSAERFFRAELISTQSLIATARPRLLLIDTGYGREGTIAAAKRAEIPCWELQHGMLGREHMGYMYNRSSVPQDRGALPFPDRFFAYGDYFRGLMEESGYCAQGSVVSLGSPRLEHFQELVLPPAWEARPFRVLVSSQWLVSEALADFLRAACSDLPSEIEVLVKAHPLESDDAIAQYRRIGASVRILPRDSSFYTALHECHLHASVFSTTLFESVGLSIPTVILGLPGWTNAKPLVDSGAADFIESPDSFREHILHLMQQRESYERLLDRASKNAEPFWAKGPGPRFQEILRGELEQVRGIF